MPIPLRFMKSRLGEPREPDPLLEELVRLQTEDEDARGVPLVARQGPDESLENADWAKGGTGPGTALGELLERERRR